MLICCCLCLCTYLFIYIESLPYISPDGINASLSDTVEFRCIVPSDTVQIGWYINGTSASLIAEDVLANRGITIKFISGTNTSFALLSIQARAVNDNTTLQCRIATSSDQVARSEEVLLQIQGKYVVYMSMKLAIILQVSWLPPLHWRPLTPTPLMTYWYGRIPILWTSLT